MPWTDKINVEQLPEDYQLMARCIGLEATVKLANELKSVHLYLKHPDKLFLAAKNEWILEKFNGMNHRLLALEVGVSERYVYDLVAESREKSKQGSLFDENMTL